MAAVFFDLGYTWLLFCASIFCSSESAVAGGFRTTQIGPKPIWNETHLDKLKKDLFMNYDKYARPEHHANATYVKVALTVLRVEADEPKSTLIVHSWFLMEWTDSKLKWNENNYGGQTVIRVAGHEVWRPDIYLYNSASGGKQLTRVGNPNVLVYNDGRVFWVSPVELLPLCEFNFRYWPFDTQKCYVKIASWVYSDVEIALDLDNNGGPIVVKPTILGSPWTVNTTSEKVVKRYACCTETYSNVVFNFTLTRKSAPYYAIVVTPAVVTVFLILIPFWLPPQAGEKIIVNGFTFVVLNLFLLYFNHQVLGVASETPLIVSFFSSNLYVVGFSMMVAIVSVTVCKIKKHRPVPQSIKLFLEGRLGKWLFLDQFPKKMHSVSHEDNIEEMEDHQVSDLQNESEEQMCTSSVQLEWIILFVAIDRIVFAVYCFNFVILSFLYL